jgi:hypothetical protein
VRPRSFLSCGGDDAMHVPKRGRTCGRLCRPACTSKTPWLLLPVTRRCGGEGGGGFGGGGGWRRGNVPADGAYCRHLPGHDAGCRGEHTPASMRLGGSAAVNGDGVLPTHRPLLGAPRDRKGHRTARLTSPRRKTWRPFLAYTCLVSSLSRRVVIWAQSPIARQINHSTREVYEGLGGRRMTAPRLAAAGRGGGS